MTRLYIIIIITFFAIYHQVLAIENSKKTVFDANKNTYINTKNIKYNYLENKVELGEDSLINIGDTNLYLNGGSIDYQNNQIYINNNFYLHEGLTILRGKNLNGNITLENFSAEDVNYLYNNEMKIDSKKVTRNKNTVYFFNNFITPCEIDGFFNCPTWSLKIDKTKYEEAQDKFTHYDSFLQIADYKIFYVPYFSHYGSKAGRKKGFLTPSLELNLSGKNTSIFIPYYLPINISSDILFKPKLPIIPINQYDKSIDLTTTYRNLSATGYNNIELINNYKKDRDEIYSTARIESRHIINKNNKIEFNGVFTNSVSNTRSKNIIPLTYENIRVKGNTYNLFLKNDYLSSEISTVEAYDDIDKSLVPFQPDLFYVSNFYINDYTLLINKLNLSVIKRNNSSISSPSENKKINISNKIIHNNVIKNFFINNTFTINNMYSNYNFEHDSNINNEVSKSSFNFSSELFPINSYNIKPRLKFKFSEKFKESQLIVNEDSKAITFNYYNLFSENRLFGSDIQDYATTASFGIESNNRIMNIDIDTKIGQSYDFKLGSNYLKEINQNTNLSDLALEANLKFKEISFKLDTRLDKNDLSKKEMNYLLQFQRPINLEISYNETNQSAFRNISSDSKSLILNLNKKINENLEVAMTSNLDLKNGFSPYTQEIIVSLSDECSKLSLEYANSRFNDNFNTSPSETINLIFYMNYIGFVGYQQSTNLFFEETGVFNYGRSG